MALLLSAYASMASASSIDVSLSAAPNPVADGDTVTVEINLTTTILDIASGAFNITWDSSLLTFTDFSFTPQNAGADFFDFDIATFSPNSIENISFGTFSDGLNNEISIIGTLTFLAGVIDPSGTSVNIASNGSPWTRGPLGQEGIELNYTSAVITGVVPLPAAAWFFGTSLIGLLAVRRRKLHNPATV